MASTGVSKLRRGGAGPRPLRRRSLQAGAGVASAGQRGVPANCSPSIGKTAHWVQLQF